MARNTAPEDEPTSNWEHSHAVQQGDEYEHETGDVFQVTSVNEDRSVDVELINEEHDVSDTWSEEAVRTSLVHGEMERVSDGKSRELATF